MKYPCLVLDHDDTVVNSTATIHHPAFCAYLLEIRPGRTITLEEYMELSRPQKDILIELLLPEVETNVCAKMMRKSYGDYSMFCLSCARAKEQWTIAAGALPSHARLAKKTMETMNHGTVRKSDAARLAESVTDEFVFGTNDRGSAEYRRELCRVFAKRSIEELADDDSCNS